MNDLVSQKHKIGPVDKLKLLAYAAPLHLTGSELAVLIIITDMINHTTQTAWPSFKVIAEKAGVTLRTAKKAVAKLCSMTPAILIIKERGDRTRSNRYMLNAELLDGQAGSDPRNTSVVSQKVNGGVPEEPKVVSDTTPKSIHYPEHKARDRVDRSNHASPVRPGAARGSHSKGDRYPEFWDAIPKRSSVAESEQLIADAIDRGFTYEDIVEGAWRFANYCAATSGAMRVSPAWWLRMERWRDDWQPPKIPISADKSTAEPANRSSEPLYRRKSSSITYLRLCRILGADDFGNIAGKLRRHIESCEICIAGFENDGIENERYDRDLSTLYCPDGNALLNNSREHDRITPILDRYWNDDCTYPWEVKAPGGNKWETVKDEDLEDKLESTDTQSQFQIAPDDWFDVESNLPDIHIDLWEYNPEHLAWAHSVFEFDNSLKILNERIRKHRDPEYNSSCVRCCSLTPDVEDLCDKGMAIVALRDQAIDGKNAFIALNPEPSKMIRRYPREGSD